MIGWRVVNADGEMFGTVVDFVHGDYSAFIWIVDRAGFLHCKPSGNFCDGGELRLFPPT